MKGIFTLQLDQDDLLPNEVCCKDILDRISKAGEGVFIITFDKESPPKKTYKTPGLIFRYKRKNFKVANKRLPVLKKAVEDALAGEHTEFMLGFRVISCVGIVKKEDFAALPVQD